MQSVESNFHLNVGLQILRGPTPKMGLPRGKSPPTTTPRAAYVNSNWDRQSSMEGRTVENKGSRGSPASTCGDF